jgi:hypothetical protein
MVDPVRYVPPDTQPASSAPQGAASGGKRADRFAGALAAAISRAPRPTYSAGDDEDPEPQPIPMSAPILMPKSASAAASAASSAAGAPRARTGGTPGKDG